MWVVFTSAISVLYMEIQVFIHSLLQFNYIKNKGAYFTASIEQKIGNVLIKRGYKVIRMNLYFVALCYIGLYIFWYVKKLIFINAL